MPLTIPDIRDIDIAPSCGKLTPPLKDIPKSFHFDHNQYVKLFDFLFFNDMTALENLKAKPGIDLNKHLRFFEHCASTFHTKHEHKTAACAWILSETFEEPSDNFFERIKE